MNQDRERAFNEGASEDRISGLPRNVIDRILELLPVKDAARTCVLSKSWRYTWATLPYLVFSGRCCFELAENSESKFREVVDEIMLRHMGNIVKFVLDVRRVHLSSYADINRWLLYVTRNGVKKLTFSVSNISNDNSYELPHCVFNCPTLTHLELTNCVFRVPASFIGFRNLVTLRLVAITFLPTNGFCIINAPLLAKLTLNSCYGTEYLKVISLGLKSLYIRENHYYPVLNCFMNCKDLREVELEFDGVGDTPNHDAISVFEKLLVSLPALEVLHSHSFIAELLSADVVQCGLPFRLNCLCHLQLPVDFRKMGQTSYALQLINSSPNLSKLEIWVDSNRDVAEAVFKYLDTPGCLERPLNKLNYVTFYYFESSKTELLFVKLLLSHTPSLLRVCIKPRRGVGSKNLATELSLFPRASPNAELVVI